MFLTLQDQFFRLCKLSIVDWLSKEKKNKSTPYTLGCSGMVNL